jgi:hypothetical protein
MGVRSRSWLAVLESGTTQLYRLNCSRHINVDDRNVKECDWATVREH